MTAADIYVYSPSGAVGNKQVFDLAIEQLQAYGYKLQIDSSALAKYQRFAGSDQQRIEAIYRAASSKAKVILPTRGGYGLVRLLAQLDYEQIAGLSAGKIWLGYSDLTALQAALYSKVKYTTWHGPMLADFASDVAVTQMKLKQLANLMNGEHADFCWFSNTIINLPQTSTIEGIAWGGNLTVLTNLIGSQYMPNIGNGILYLEDIGEHPYKIERMLMQLLHSGVLQQQQAILLGQFSDYQLYPTDNGFDLDQVIQNIAQKINTPIITDLPFGHQTRDSYLAFGKKIQLELSNKQQITIKQ